MWPTCGQSGYITPTVLGFPNAQGGDENQRGLCGGHVVKVATSPLLCWGWGTKKEKWVRGPHVGKVATTPFPSWGSPPLRAWIKIRNGYGAHTWVTCGQSDHITPAALGVPNAYCRGKNQRWLRGPRVGKVATSPLPPWGSRALGAGTKIITGCVGELWAKGLHHPCRLEGPPRSLRGGKSEMAMWPTCGQSGYIAPTVLGVGNAHRVRQNDQWLRSPHVGKVATSPVPSSRVPNSKRGDENQK